MPLVVVERALFPDAQPPSRAGIRKIIVVVAVSYI
jgi:hypothetical protein